ncbi:Outer membrane efflux protein [Posidoniimonas corsicana]|uniref:Outer membrane efflux protein n=1 Tax=Posidoniimonas corsicana TaxID=1938618 RepID=A0A5C5VAA0_9BACT|nr:TolC family protein [Posidoniimonas corsicana]TWT35546.1 Outer membrane efflux protein [Posidoniimonas corsicana]
MRWLEWVLACSVSMAAVAPGCRTARPATSAAVPTPIPDVQPAAYQAPAPSVPGEDAAEEEETLRLPPLDAGEPEEVPLPVSAPSVEQLAASVRLHFPLVQQAVAARVIASGEALAAAGAFDRKLEGASISQPLDFYENYRHEIGVKRDTYWGGETFAGYRVGRGDFEPWYQERQTNEGGEFKLGFLAPLARDRGIDENRAELWRAQLERGRVEPEIRAMIIGSVRDATAVYWQWVASAAAYRIAGEVLQLGLDRADYLERQVDEGEKAQIDIVDNRRIIVSRQAKLTDARRKLEQSAVKLSLFLRDDTGRPVVLPLALANVTFPDALAPEAWGEQADVPLAQANRPELEELQLARRQLAVLLRQANNETRPRVDAGLLAAQDVGAPTSAKRDKSELKLEASVLLSVPLERRKALGKARQLRGKIAQLRAKTRFASDKIAAETQAAHVGLTAAAERAAQTTEGVALAERMQAAEERLYREGQSTLFNLNLREQQLAEAAIARVEALYDYHVALADYAAALGFESAASLEPLARSGF